MSLVHKTKKEEGKKHKTKKKTQKKQQIFKIKLRKDRFRMFGPHSKPISAIPAWFKANFGLFWPFWSVSATGQYDPILAESSWIEAELAQIRAELARTCKKKKLKRGTNAASDAGAAPILPCPCIIEFLVLKYFCCIIIIYQFSLLQSLEGVTIRYLDGLLFVCT